MAETNENLKLTKSVFRKASFWEVGKSGTYENPWKGYKMPSAWNGLTWKFTGTDNSDVPSQEELDETLPIIKPDLNVLKRPPERGLRVTWIGHATVLVQFDSISVLTDPVFSNRCSPCRGFGPKRYRKVPCSIKELPKIDAVVISHTHYDHLDYNSVRELNEKFGKELAWFVPKGLAAWMHSCGCENVKEMDWWDELKLDGKENITFAFTPSQHWCRRGALDYNTVLWGSWCIFGPTKKFFFGGDSGYCDAFKEIGAKYKEGFDLAAIPIGAYEPRWIMQCNHMDPEEAVKTHVDIKARRSVGIHWGTFVMANEYYLEPPTKLKEALLQRELQEEAFFVLKHGESKLIVDEYDNVD